jgi:uroporphyrin-3 C-methyltransferase
MSDVAASPDSMPASTARGGRAPAAGKLVAGLALVALLAGGYAAWRAWWLEHGAASALAEARRADAAAAAGLARLTRELEQARAALTQLERKQADLEAVNRSLREELLGIGERASIVEDALANLAEKRTGGALAMRLNEIEFLLRLGQERLALFGDRRATLTAFRLADAELARLDDPALAGVRQTLALEIAALTDPNAEAPARAMAALDRATAALPALRARPHGPPPASASAETGGVLSRAGAVLSQYVRVRRLEADEAALANPLNLEATRAAAALELLLAKAALTIGDRARFRDAASEARARIAGAFDREQAEVQAALLALDDALALPQDATMPELGRALAELGNLRAARALAEEAPAAATPPGDGAP